MTSPCLFPQYAETIRGLNIASIRDSASVPRTLEMARDGNITINYIPFDYLNTKAKIVLVGITPGFTQLRNALAEAQKQLKSGTDHNSALMAAKRTGAFSGSMRPNLISMLDHLGVNNLLGISTCDTLFSKDSHLVHTTSVLRYPVFVDGENYNGSPNMTRQPLLNKQLTDYFANEVSELRGAIFVPLGPKVFEAMEYLVERGAIDETRILGGMPHPSGANAERIAYFLGKKDKSQLSVKTDPTKIDEAKAALIKKVAYLRTFH